MTPPRPPLPGQPILPWAKRLLEYVVATRPVAGPGLRARLSASGTVLSASRAVVPATPASHPFKLSVTDGELSVGFGCLDIMTVLPDADSKPYMALERASVTVGAGSLNGGPEAWTGGSITLDLDTDYGIWFEFEWSHLSPFDQTAGVTGQFVTWNMHGLSLGVTVIASEDFLEPSTAAITSANSLRSYLYIGRVNMADGVAAVFQHLRSDLVLPAMTFPESILSSENVSLEIGTDGGISYEDP